MNDVIGPMLLGILICALGVSNRKGNISSIHWYHRQRVREEDRLPFGRLMGLGTIICGVSMVIFGGLTFVAEKTQTEGLIMVGSVIVVAGLIAGLALSFYAMFKYNKGIF